jgi:hypothetical protein
LTAPTFASETSGISVSDSGSTSVSDIMKQLYINYFAVFHGTPLKDLSSPYSLDHNGKHSKTSFNTINFDSDLTAAYMATSDIGIGADIPFLLVPVQGQGIILGDVGLKTFHKHLISMNGLNVLGNLYLQAPTNQFDRERGMLVGIKSTPAIRYIVPSSRFTLGAWNEVKWYSAVHTGKTFKLYTQPYVSYTLTRSVALNVGYEIESDHFKNDPALNFTTYETDLMPGFVWFATSKVMVNPYLQIFTGNKVNTGTTALGAVVSATL